MRAVKKVPTGQVSAGAALWSESADPEEGLEVAPSSVSGVGPGGGRTAEGRAPAAAVMGAGKPPVSGGVAAASPDEVAGEVDLFTRVHRRYRAVPIP